MRLAIGIPCYHSKDFLINSLGSIAIQTCAKDLDVILSFDGDDTADATISFVQQLYEPLFHRVFYLKNSRKQGIGGNRNNILHFLYNRTESDATHLLFMDHDDSFLSPLSMAEYSQAINEAPDIDMFLSPIIEELPNNQSQIHSWDNNTWVHGRIFKISSIKKYDLYFPLHPSEDNTFCAITTFFCRKTLQFNTPYYLWRYNEKSLSRNITTDYFKQCGVGFTLSKIDCINVIMQKDSYHEAMLYGFFQLAAVYYNSFCNYSDVFSIQAKQAITYFLKKIDYYNNIQNLEYKQKQTESFLYTKANTLLVGSYLTMGFDEWIDYYSEEKWKNE